MAGYCSRCIKIGKHPAGVGYHHAGDRRVCGYCLEELYKERELELAEERDAYIAWKAQAREQEVDIKKLQEELAALTTVRDSSLKLNLELGELLDVPASRWWEDIPKKTRELKEELAAVLKRVNEEVDAQTVLIDDNDRLKEELATREESESFARFLEDKCKRLEQELAASQKNEIRYEQQWRIALSRLDEALDIISRLFMIDPDDGYIYIRRPVSKQDTDWIRGVLKPDPEKGGET